jgi:hypothetical protein
MSYSNITSNNFVNLSPVSLTNTSLTPKQLHAIQPLAQLNGSFMFSSENNLHPHVKKYEVYETPTDVLALSVAWKRLRDNGHSGIGKLLQDELFSKVADADIEMAKKIRDYYSKKIMMLTLRNDNPNMTAYRKDLNTFVHGDGRMVRENMLGLAYYLPIFYEYDVNIDEVRCAVDANQNFKKLDKENKPKLLKLSVELQPLKMIVRKTKRITTNQYWLKDLKLNAGVLISIQLSNPLEHIWNDMFLNTKVLQVNGSFCRRTIDNFEYFSVDKWHLAKG